MLLVDQVMLKHCVSPMMIMFGHGEMVITVNWVNINALDVLLISEI